MAGGNGEARQKTNSKIIRHIISNPKNAGKWSQTQKSREKPRAIDEIKNQIIYKTKKAGAARSLKKSGGTLMG